jgi:hypothetical protein
LGYVRTTWSGPSNAMCANMGPDPVELPSPSMIIIIINTHHNGCSSRLQATPSPFHHSVSATSLSRPNYGVGGDMDTLVKHLGALKALRARQPQPSAASAPQHLHLQASGTLPPPAACRHPHQPPRSLEGSNDRLGALEHSKPISRNQVVTASEAVETRYYTDTQVHPSLV